MATIVAAQTGDWSAGATWDGGTPPGVGDTAQTGAYAVTIDQDITVTQLNPTSSGYFKVTAADIDIVADVVMASTYNGGGLRFEHAAGTCTLTGSVTGGSAINTYGVRVQGAGDLTIAGNMTGGSGATSHGVINASTGTVTLTGNATGGSSSGCGVQNNSTGTITVSGTATGGSGVVSYGAINVSTGTVRVGTAVGGTYVTSGQVSCGLFGANSGGTTTFKVAQHSTVTVFPLGGFCQVEYDQDVNYIRVTRDSDDANVDLSNDYPAEADVEIGVVYQLGNLTGTLDVGCDYPAESDVRLGVDYDSGGSTGTLDLPAEADVQEGVTFDGATQTGTFAAPSEDDVRDGTTYGAAAEFTGNMTLPAEEDVETGVTYGTDGTEYTGTLAGGSDWTADEKEQIRMALGITGDTAPTSGTGNLDTILTAVSDLSTDEEIGTAVVAAMDADPPAVNVTYSAGVALGGRLAEASELPDVSALALEATAQAILEDTGTTLPALISAGGAGSGSTEYSNTVTDSDSNPLDGVEVWITSDSGGASTVASTTTDTLGAFTVYLDPGTYYLWLAKGGYNFGNPTTITVS